VNDWSWHKLANIVWVNQPAGAGFSQGTVTATDEFGVAQQFMGFWKNFVDIFSMQGYKVYVTGSSYSGMYLPIHSSVMLDANDTTYFNVTGMQVWDGTFGNHALTEDIPTATFMARIKDVFSIHDTFTEFMHDASQSCGYTDYMSKYLVYPAVGSQLVNLPGQDANNNYLPGCDVFDQAFFAMEEVNPCFSPYSIFFAVPYCMILSSFPTATTIYPPDPDQFISTSRMSKLLSTPHLTRHGSSVPILLYL
jgi:carboxypeptidase D